MATTRYHITHKDHTETLDGDLHEAVERAHILALEHLKRTGETWGASISSVTLLGHVHVDGHFDSVN